MVFSHKIETGTTCTDPIMDLDPDTGENSNSKPRIVVVNWCDGVGKIQASHGSCFPVFREELSIQIRLQYQYT